MLTVHEIAAASAGEISRGQGDRVVTSVSTDSRDLAPGALYIPLVGERFDGHAFLADAAARGAAAVLTARAA
ncbi:MAG: UDP-N-acetylmuramoyl-tripeptide--D-alanyl-D-alanine ligase, partial [Candidatus Sericytochromatia bacterium]|nr:UDP-N-acetylmuramoyl-tripeptide--D-alanyl-D-alanine ligase [Candidatus Tanganyikabacteria bacterium]